MKYHLTVPTTFSKIGSLEYEWITTGCGFLIEPPPKPLVEVGCDPLPFNAEFPQTRVPDNCSECEAHFTEPSLGSFVHKGRHTECVGALVVVVAAVEMLGLFVWLVVEGLWAAVRGVWE